MKLLDQSNIFLHVIMVLTRLKKTPKNEKNPNQPTNQNQIKKTSAVGLQIDTKSIIF